MKHLILFIFLYGCASSQADESVVSANEVQKETFARTGQVIESIGNINENTFLIVKRSCLTFCFNEEVVCICKCNTGLNKLRNVTSRYSLKYVSQWDNYIDEWALTTQEKVDCEPI